ncbi:MAG TPA: deoxyribose-phosphate aldolase [Phycisphaerales bacterium]|nr:deoxyribose-phosphate aldolase [Phycisphaerales bacterium]
MSLSVSKWSGPRAGSAPASPTVDAVMAAERAASFSKRSIKSSAKVAGLKLALSMVDLTTLEGKDSPEKVRGLCRKAMLPDPADRTLPMVAAVCVYPSLVKIAKETLGQSGVKVASVATGFPSGQYPLDIRLDDVRRACEDGADEIDMVINRGAFLAGRYEEVAEEIRQVKRACMHTGAHLKVILETGELETLDNVRRASDLAIRAMAEVDDELGVPETNPRGTADFIKTSTGKVQPAATMPVTLVMLEAIRDWYLKTGRVVGMKPAGGIRTAKQSLHYLVMIKETLGNLPAPEVGESATAGGHCPWLTPDYFRFGASALCNDILRQLGWIRTGKYMAGYDYSES